jgi:predicted DNA-binding transcriptional regulator AlpA
MSRQVTAINECARLRPMIMRPLAEGMVMNEQTELPRVLGIKQVAVMLGRTEKAVRRMWEKGKMPNPVRIDSRLQWDSRDILNLIERGKSPFGEEH